MLPKILKHMDVFFFIYSYFIIHETLETVIGCRANLRNACTYTVLRYVCTSSTRLTQAGTRKHETGVSGPNHVINGYVLSFCSTPFTQGGMKKYHTNSNEIFLRIQFLFLIFHCHSIQIDKNVFIVSK